MHKWLALSLLSICRKLDYITQASAFRDEPEIASKDKILNARKFRMINCIKLTISYSYFCISDYAEVNIAKVVVNTGFTDTAIFNFLNFLIQISKNYTSS